MIGSRLTAPGVNPRQLDRSGGTAFSAAAILWSGPTTIALLAEIVRILKTTESCHLEAATTGGCLWKGGIAIAFYMWRGG